MTRLNILMRAVTMAAVLGAGSGGVALAQDDAVATRQAGMKAIGGSVRTLGNMAKGTVAFDAAAAQAALDKIAQEAALIPVHFEAEVIEGDTEAKPAIWTDWDSFVADAKALEDAAGTATVASADDLAPAMATIGATCKTCHSEFRS
ncbi:Cytochrome c' precursor [Aquimixticola soesokkakensis]|uniref:Cytochrome c n=1 Tax=Aquimixticola soesokkakensis TaxID=1519096 RepID=A0A1Y5RF11_9RHOB|nr:cytochrome c [Aquimixticola soesokkakensis]SLN15961.1 Cytochrome c' precursor [Aquimixticola soesokkakensis]